MTDLGKVFLIGAGPGDPELMTIKGWRALRQADVVLYDALVSPALLEDLPPGTARIDVGKRCGRHGVSQEAIHRLLIRYARRGRCVARLKGGDPFVFGRGGEEMLALLAAGIPFEIVPGVTSAVAAPACAGIPVTHRGTSSMVTVVTGHDCGSASIDWEGLARLDGTVVVLMGVGALPRIIERLIAAGMSPSMPVAIVEHASTSRQRVLRGTLQTIPQVGIASPAVIVIGRVAALADCEVPSITRKEKVSA